MRAINWSRSWNFGGEKSKKLFWAKFEEKMKKKHGHIAKRAHFSSRIWTHSHQILQHTRIIEPVILFKFQMKKKLVNFKCRIDIMQKTRNKNAQSSWPSNSLILPSSTFNFMFFLKNSFFFFLELLKLLFWSEISL